MAPHKALTERKASLRQRGQPHPPAWVERWIEDAWTRVRGEQPLRADCKAGLVAIAAWTAHVIAMGEALQFDRTYSHMVRGFGRYIGWQTTGSSKRDNRLHARSIKRRLELLVELGWLAGVEPVMEVNGEGRCLRLTVNADVAQLARAPLS